MTDNEMKEVGEIIKIAMQGNENATHVSLKHNVSLPMYA